MGSTALMVLLMLMGTAYSKPSKPVCQYPCSPTEKLYLPHFHHMSELQHSSVAPWNIINNETEGREPYLIQHAECQNCTVKDMVAKPIFIQISVYKRLQHNTQQHSWCRCPYNLAVGCTCVREQRQ